MATVPRVCCQTAGRTDTLGASGLPRSPTPDDGESARRMAQGFPRPPTPNPQPPFSCGCPRTTEPPEDPRSLVLPESWPSTPVLSSPVADGPGDRRPLAVSEPDRRVSPIHEFTNQPIHLSTRPPAASCSPGWIAIGSRCRKSPRGGSHAHRQRRFSFEGRCFLWGGKITECSSLITTRSISPTS
jgi:hypothetical protein